MDPALGELVQGDFFFSSRRRHTRFDCDWSSDVYSSDLAQACRWIEPVGWFVKEDQLWTMNDRLCEFGQLLHSERVGLETSITGFAESDVKQCFVCSRSEERRVGKECRLPLERFEVTNID